MSSQAPIHIPCLVYPVLGENTAVQRVVAQSGGQSNPVPPAPSPYETSTMRLHPHALWMACESRYTPDNRGWVTLAQSMNSSAWP